MQKREPEFARNKDLEKLLIELNTILWHSERTVLPVSTETFPIVFLVGPHRSGTTLFLQWIASIGHFCYPTNFLSRFYSAPIVGSKIQLLLTDERYNFRNELGLFDSTERYRSKNGKTRGLLSPNEFWYFWRRFLRFTDLDYFPSEVLDKMVEIEVMRAELIGVTNVFQKPLVLKAMILNYNIDFLYRNFKRAIFVYMKRNPETNVLSALQARERQFGSEKVWYSFKIPEYENLKSIEDPVLQTTNQIFCINRAVERGLKNVDENRKLTVQYEDFCSCPEAVYKELIGKINAQGYHISTDYNGKRKFAVSNRRGDKRLPMITEIYSSLAEKSAHE